jgi:hypothetical protein
VTAYVLGKEVMASLKIVAFEFVRNYVLKGLSPRTNEGDPYPPSQVVFDFIAKLEQELANRDEEAWNLVGLEREKYVAAHIEPLQDRLQNYRSYLDCVQDYSWAEFGLPHDYELAALFIETLVNSRYVKEEVTRFLPWPVKSPPMPQSTSIQPRPAKLHHSQECKLNCRKIARHLWEQDPLLTIAEMIKKPGIIENSKKTNGMPYSEATIRNWISCLCPNRKRGRRAKKPLEK